MKKVFSIGLFFCLTILSGFSQQSSNSATDTVIVFKFASQNNQFYNRGNETELDRLYSFVEQYTTEITSGQLPIYVNGYCASFDNEKENLQTARLRSNRVKAQLILKKGLKEENFITVNHANAYETQKDVVTVSILLKNLKEEPQVQPQLQPQPQPQPELVVEVEQPQQPSETEDPTTTVVSQNSHFSLRTNLLYWLATIPNIGIEWKPSDNFGILVNGLWNHWIWGGEDKQYRTWMVSPEVRYYLGENKAWFIGIEGHISEFNFKFKHTGYQGDAIGGGLTGGYKLKLSRTFDLDFALGLGYTQLKYDSYFRSREVMVRKEAGLKKDFFGPTQAGVSLIWKIK
jgi:hypothetical protein